MARFIYLASIAAKPCARLKRALDYLNEGVEGAKHFGVEQLDALEANKANLDINKALRVEDLRNVYETSFFITSWFKEKKVSKPCLSTVSPSLLQPS